MSRTLAACAAAAAAFALAAADGSAAGVRRAYRRAPASRLQAFVLADAPDSLADLRAHAREIGVVYPTYFECELESGRVLGRDNAAITAYALSQHMALMPRFSCQDGATVHTLLTEPATRASALARLVAIASQPSYAGLSLDLENDAPSDRQALTSFVATLALRLHRRARKLSVVVDGVTGEDAPGSAGLYDYRALAAVSDSVFVLAWGTHWASSAPGPIAPLGFVEAVARFIATLPSASRFVLGVPMYGLDWPPGGGPAHPATAYQYSSVISLARSVGAKPVRDRSADELTFSYTRAHGATRTVWFLDARSVADRLAVGRRYGLALGVWRLGREDQAVWTSAPLMR